jgi:integrase
MLVVARKRGLIEAVPHVEWLKNEKPEFDFCTFDEAKRLVAAADGEWQTMILVALRTGMRIGELLALQWQDVDLVAGRITVRRNVVWGHLGTPKSGKSREIPLSNDAIKALKDHRAQGPPNRQLSRARRGNQRSRSGQPAVIHAAVPSSPIRAAGRACTAERRKRTDDKRRVERSRSVGTPLIPRATYESGR